MFLKKYKEIYAQKKMPQTVKTC
jgi:hypothetical protein